jgi:hypothetical protein
LGRSEWHRDALGVEHVGKGVAAISSCVHVKHGASKFAAD